MSYRTLFFTALLAALHSVALAQLPQPRLYGVQPPGGQQGQTVEVSLVGDDLEEITTLIFDHPGLTAIAKTTEVDGKPVPVDRVFIVTAAADVPIGPHEVRCQGLWGVSNARRFYVGNRPQGIEIEPNNSLDKSMPLTVGSAVLGLINGPADVDLFKFNAVAGQRLVIDCQATIIDSKLRPSVEIYDVRRRRLQVTRGDGINDPVLVFDVSTEGEYTLKLHDAAFHGGNEYCYRLDVHQAPHIVFAYPPSGMAGQSQRVSLYGYNLPGSERVTLPGYTAPLEKLDVDLPIPGDGATLQLEERTSSRMSSIDAFSYRWQGQSNVITLGIAHAPVVVEAEPNDQPSHSQRVSVPAEIVGQFATARDADMYTIDAKAGEVYYIEVFGQRLGQTIDPYVTIDRITTDANGGETLQRVAAPDDEPTNPLPNQFEVRSDDPVQQLVVPTDGMYRITVRDRFGESRGSVANVYRLSIHQEAPDFRLVSLPASPVVGSTWSMSMRRGDTFAMQVIAFRRDGFNGPIDVKALDLPPGIECAGTTIPDGLALGMLHFRTRPDAAEGWFPFRIEGLAKIEDPRLVRAAAAAAAAIPEIEKGLAPAQQALTAATAKVPPAQEVFTKAEEVLQAKPDDAGLVQQRDVAKAALDAAVSAEQTAKDALAAIQQKVTDQKNASAQAAQANIAAVREVIHPSRVGEIVWTSVGNVPAVAQIQPRLGISVMAESAPYQLVADPIRIEVVQGRQILVPVKLEKRDGFNDKVTLTAAGMKPNSNIETPNIAIEKDQAETIWRLLVKDNALPGTHSLWLTSTAPVPYRRNPAKAARLKAEFDAVAALAKTASEAAAAATTAKNEAITKATQSTETVKKTQTDQQTAKKAADDSKTASDVALATQVEAEKLATTAAESVKTAQAAFDAAKATADADAANQDLKNALTTAEQALTTAKQASDTAETAKTNATKTATDASTTAATAAAALKVTDELLAKITADDQVIQAAKIAAENDETAKLEASKALEVKRVAAEKASNDQNTASNPNNINFTPSAVPVVLVVKPAPWKLAANVPNGGNVKKGDKLEVKVSITRQNGFSGPMVLSLPVPPGVTGISAVEVTVPADQSEGTLTLTTAGDAKDGAIANLVIQGKGDFGGEVLVDVPVTITITP